MQTALAAPYRPLAWSDDADRPTLSGRRMGAGPVAGGVHAGAPLQAGPPSQPSAESPRPVPPVGPAGDRIAAHVPRPGHARRAPPHPRISRSRPRTPPRAGRPAAESRTLWSSSRRTRRPRRSWAPAKRATSTSWRRNSRVAANYRAIMHPSLPNYLALTSGTNAGITSDCKPKSCTARCALDRR